ncbi:hypothetical protein ACP70R_019880 [Stipagrostis hirtigluma subsp. patula]
MELGQLTKLRCIGIFIANSETIHEQESILVASLCKLGASNLRSLTVDVFSKDLGDGSGVLYFDNFDGPLWPLALQTLRKFRMKSGYFTKVLDWMGSLIHLEKLVLRLLRIGQEDLDILGDLPNLLCLLLGLSECPGESLIIRGNKFQCLKYLRAPCYPGRGLMLKFEAGSMLRLEHLEINIRFNVDRNYICGIEHLCSLTTFDVQIHCEWYDNALAAEINIRNAIKNLPNKPTFKIRTLKHPYVSG